MRMKVQSEVRVYERDGAEVPVGSHAVITISSHWNRSDLVVLQVDGSAATITVTARELEAAIRNAMNTGGM